VQLLSTKECLNAKKSEVTYPEFVYNHLLHVLVLAMRIWRVAVVPPSPSYITATTREIDKPREILPK
jgi:hypothetical protein